MSLQYMSIVLFMCCEPDDRCPRTSASDKLTLMHWNDAQCRFSLGYSNINPRLINCYDGLFKTADVYSGECHARITSYVFSVTDDRIRLQLTVHMYT